ncbi:MAG: DUF1289 domain-containing protein [Gammaproteobacteria bacterium]|nr:DUF1289 domain-containing protein [Gammaproteobacteria bacterium]
MNPSFRAVLSPCTGVCALDEQGLCLGCHRSAAEIASWLHLDDDQRLHLIETVLPQREAERA